MPLPTHHYGGGSGAGVNRWDRHKAIIFRVEEQVGQAQRLLSSE